MQRLCRRLRCRQMAHIDVLVAGAIALLIPAVDRDLIIRQAAHHCLEQAIDASANNRHAGRTGLNRLGRDHQ